MFDLTNICILFWNLSFHLYVFENKKLLKTMKWNEMNEMKYKEYIVSNDFKL